MGYYLGGLALGLIILAFFLRGKKTSCSYSPNARTIKNINIKTLVFQDFENDSIAIRELLKDGDVDFSKSNTELDSCKIYFIDGTATYEGQHVILQNCDKEVIITTYKK